MHIKVGTRGSKLALAQTNSVIEALKKVAPEIEVEICVIRTSGDIMQDVSLAQIGGQGVFVKEIEEALLARSIDLAVHSMKDVPGETPEGLIFAAVMEREDARDVLVSRGNVKMEFMPKGARIGTGSLRRAAQIKAMLPDVSIMPLRGNIDTRLKKIETENLTGVILAAAGMKRMGYLEKITQYLPVELMLPAVGQGALGLEIRMQDTQLSELCAKMNDEQTAAEVAAERAYLRALGGGCRLPIAAYGLLEGKRLTLEGILAAPNGSTVIRDKVWGEIGQAEELGKKLADLILEKGGKRLLDLMC
ncbi:MAG TPA: hydroxymethylbilane synthase [Smithellaceae bacterium]|nr:hydroxymethylbilane synthase [Smithellaceae bacterium]HNT91905.1 hydroxymethylbilane synthase [Smithellaceae bacterium]HNV64031.1 hydroxymethylbilane synthase [Smithellaceae bacterium]HNZ31640.1 hydroxymethylbilane synthase [Smithellaceae bacterium]HOF78490.1 hydroxymethylbilane synthase [Smithellaceae bacterium]